MSLTAWVAIGLAATLSILLTGAGILRLRRSAGRESMRLRHQRELRELLEVSTSEAESHRLLISHVERVVPGAGAALLDCNRSEDRLEPRLGESVEGTPLCAIETAGLKPRSCMAVRLSRPYSRRPGEEPLQRCETCGKITAGIICEPLLVGGEVIGSVLVTRDGVISTRERDRVRESVVQAAPILANQRNLARAELRAACDSLTGLPNRHTVDETIKRMAAHAGRTITSLSAILLDLDHFEQVNAVHGHDQGDQALAAISQILLVSLRTSDFTARYGGEAFLLLLPDTSRVGAVEVAEKLRRSIMRAEINRIGTITASFGIASLPEDASGPADLIRQADRALQGAKDHGRNRVEVAAAMRAGELSGGTGEMDP